MSTKRPNTYDDMRHVLHWMASLLLGGTLLLLGGLVLNVVHGEWLRAACCTLALVVVGWGFISTTIRNERYTRPRRRKVVVPSRYKSEDPS